MTTQDERRELLLKDLNARLRYGIKFKADNEEDIREIHYIKDEEVYIREYQNLPYWIDNIKPYLRTLSSMTEEEREELDKIVEKFFGKALDLDVQGKMHGEDNENKVRIQECFAHGAVTDLLNANHFDYRGLIPMGLALEAHEGMY